MVQNDQLKPGETVVRILLRISADLAGPNKRQLVDGADFVRRQTHPKTRQPENGISLLRKSMFATATEIYNYIGSKKAMGTAECKLEQLTSKGFKYIVTGNREEHLSLRCPTCDKADLNSNQPCKPIGAKNFSDCQLFNADDPFDLNKIFQLAEAPAPRILTTNVDT
jgi:hypothetical protein